MIRVMDELDTELYIGDIVLYTSTQSISYNICEIVKWEIEPHYNGRFLHIGGKELYPSGYKDRKLAVTSNNLLNLMATLQEDNIYKMSGGLKLVKSDIMNRLLIQKLNK